jgi:lipoprotein-releasing system ATP-binding protein
VNTTLLSCTEIYKNFGKLPVLKGVSLEIQQGEVISIVGSSGAGKTTLLQILGTLDKPDRGLIQFKNQELQGLNKKKIAAFRNRHLGFVFQFHRLLPEFTALENAAMPAMIAGDSLKTAKLKAEKHLNYLGLSERLHHKPAALSGGEQQRVAVARALVNDPEIIMADEPSGNLDSANARELHQLFFKLRQDLGSTFIIVTHNDELAQMADRKLTMRDGQIVG